MPVATVLGMCMIVSGLRIAYILHANYKYVPKTRKPPPIAPSSGPFLFLLVAFIVSLIGYMKVVASVEEALMKADMLLFDPYEILGVSESSNKSDVTSAYRSLVKTHHPDKGGSPAAFMKLHQAYTSLTDTIGMENYKLYGHPDGQVQAPSYRLELPNWLLFPEGKVAAVMISLYLLFFVLIVVAVFKFYKNKDTNKAKGSIETDSVAMGDFGWLAKCLSPDSTPWEVLLALSSTPENLQWSTNGIAKVQTLREEKLSKQPKSGKKNDITFDNFDDAGWDDGEDEDDEEAKEAAVKAKQAEETRIKDMKQLNQATGKTIQLLEGIDEGVIGQKWVESTLKEKGFWPPSELSFINDKKFEYEGAQVNALDHPGLRRNLCCTLGRLHSSVLNSHPELVTAGTKKLIDQTYFRAAMEYRHRTGILLEAALRLTMVLRSYTLAKTILEAVAMFKIGCPDSGGDSLERVEKMLTKEYGCLPRLVIKETSVETEDEPEIATGDLCTMKIEFERTHAENYFNRKVELCKKQGIPPQMAMQSFHEVWWILVRAIKIDDDSKTPTLTPPMELSPETKPFLKHLEAVDIEKFCNANITESDALLVAWPVIISDMRKKEVVVNTRFKAPKSPGKYKIEITAVSQEYLGTACETSLEVNVLDIESIQREEKETEKDENKKEK